jgi:NitT/TauT family transport system permease protein
MLSFRSLVIGWATLLAGWVAFTELAHPSEYLLATPKQVLFYALEHRSLLQNALFVTASQAVVGWMLALVFGVALGALIFYGGFIRRLALPLVLAVQTTPVIALAPLVTLWLGFGWTAKTMVACIVAVLPLILATLSGLSHAKPNHLLLFQTAGVGRWRTFLHLRLPSAVPTIIPAANTAVVLAVVGSLVSELMGGSSGLGFLILKGVSTGQSQLLLVSALLAAVLGQVLLLGLQPISTTWLRRGYSEDSGMVEG